MLSCAELNTASKAKPLRPGEKLEEKWALLVSLGGLLRFLWASLLFISISCIEKGIRLICFLDDFR